MLSNDIRTLCITYVMLSFLKPHPRNARVHSRKQTAQIVASIRAFGFTNPILCDAQGNIIAGHGRLLAAKEMGLDQVPVIILDGLTDAQKRALMLADNKLALNAAWDAELLKLELADLAMPDLDIDLGLTGFSAGEIDVILTESQDPALDKVPAVPTSPRCSPGDIWQLGPHRVGCGDGRDGAFLQAVVGPDVEVDCAFLDPPFNVKVNGHANARGRHREFAMASGEMTSPEFQAFLGDTLGACAKVSRAGAVHFVVMDWRHAGDLIAATAPIYDDLINLCVWNKSNAGMGSLYRSKHELVFVYRVPGARHFNSVELAKHGRNRVNVWDYPSVNSFKGNRRADLDLHPTVKPVAMVADAICDVTKRGELVLDSFLGSGTSLIACERVGRRFRGVDIDPAYVDLAITRWERLTGETAELLRAANEGAAS